MTDITNARLRFMGSRRVDDEGVISFRFDVDVPDLDSKIESQASALVQARIELGRAREEIDRLVTALDRMTKLSDQASEVLRDTVAAWGACKKQLDEANGAYESAKIHRNQLINERDEARDELKALRRKL